MILFFYGPNTYASRHKLQETISAYLKKTGTEMGVERIDGRVASLEQLVSSLQAMPFLASSRLVIVEDLGSNKKVAEKIQQLCELVPASTVAIFYESAVDQRTTYFKSLSKIARVAKFEMLSTSQLTAWIGQQVKAAGGEIERGAINKLIDLVGADQWRLYQEINKLVNYCADKVISQEIVEEMVIGSEEQSIFDLVEAVVAGQQTRALKVYHSLLSSQANEIYILSMVIWQLRNLLLAKTAGAMSARELAAQTGLSPYVAEKAMSKRSTYSEEVLKSAFIESVDTDYAIKSGQGDARHLIEQLIYKIAEAAKR